MSGASARPGDPLALLEPGWAEEAARFPGDGDGRQPVHTVYGGAHLFRAGTARRLGDLALAALDEHAPDDAALAALGWPVGADLHARVVEKLEREPVEDFRLDFEDGYGQRSDEEEDGHADSSAREVAAGLAAGTLPPFVGLRIKPLTRELAGRSLRTLERFVTALVGASGGALPPGFAVTLPKITFPAQVAALAAALDALEERLGLERGAVAVELMIETPRSVFDAEGRAAPPALAAAAGGRCRGAHFGTYDYTASLGITAAEQRMDHPACDLAKQVMQVSLAGTGVQLSDGATNVLPVGERRTVHDAWRLHARHVRHSLEGAFYQGWDLHPAQLPSRYATVYAFFLAAAEAAGSRLRAFVEQAARATLSGDVFDDAATGQGLLNFFLRARACGALTAEEARRLSGLEAAELAGRSFPRILAARRGGA